MWGAMNMDLLRNVLLWCAAINYGLLIVWVLLFILPHDWMYRFYGRWFRLSAEQFDAINFAGMVFFKIGVIVLNLVPYVALCIAG